ncbi:hypothetical protein FQV17_0012860, partial [Megadyptes antipodes antipodes]
QHRMRVLDLQHRMRVLGYPQKLEGRMTYRLQRHPLLWRKPSRNLLLIWKLLLIQKLLQCKVNLRMQFVYSLFFFPVSSAEAFEKFNGNVCGNQPADSCVKPHTLPWRHKRNCAVCHTPHCSLGPAFIAATDNLIRF